MGAELAEDFVGAAFERAFQFAADGLVHGVREEATVFARVPSIFPRFFLR